MYLLHCTQVPCRTYYVVPSIKIVVKWYYECFPRSIIYEDEGVAVHSGAMELPIGWAVGEFPVGFSRLRGISPIVFLFLDSYMRYTSAVPWVYTGTYLSKLDVIYLTIFESVPIYLFIYKSISHNNTCISPSIMNIFREYDVYLSRNVDDALTKPALTPAKAKTTNKRN